MNLSRATETAAFHAFCAVGIVFSAVLAFVEARQEDAVVVESVAHVREGDLIVADAVVRNRTDATRCVEVRAAVRDGDARDLAEAEAQPVDGERRIPGKGEVRFTARLGPLSEEQHTEQVREVSLYVIEAPTCP